MANKTNYGFRSYILNYYQDYLAEYRKARFKDFIEETYIHSLEFQNKCYENKLFIEYDEFRKIDVCYIKRLQRLKKRVADILLNGNCLFLTLTFTDETLTTTNEKQRRVAVSRYLKLFNCKYVANIDFGSKNHREHYHALIGADTIDYSLWTYGAVNGQRVRNNGIATDKVRLSKYICKLSNHAIKETTKRSALIYSRS